MSPALFLLSNLLQAGAVFCFYTDFLRGSRTNRHCHRLEGGGSTSSVLQTEVFEGSKFTLVLIFITGLLFFLIFLGNFHPHLRVLITEIAGMVKGLIGLLCWRKIGEYGLNLLIDLPRTLPRYQEKSIENYPVVYDIGGWPIHPTTLQKTVRVLPKRTEFCLNMIFFLACPLAACAYSCSLCCCIRNYKSKDDVCFTHVDIVKLSNASNGNNGKPDVYKEDAKEEQDTKYVLEAMRKSKESIHSLNGK